MEMSFFGKTALVSGGSKGFGRYISNLLAKMGANVITLDNDKYCGPTTPGIKEQQVKFNDWKSTQDIVQNLCPIDCLVNALELHSHKSIAQISEESYEKNFNLSIKAIFCITQAIVKVMKARNEPVSIVNVSPKFTWEYCPNHTLYCASKGAIDFFTKYTSAELGEYNMRINAVCPYLIPDNKDHKKEAKGSIEEESLPLDRYGRYEEISKIILFLLSDQANSITGVCFPISTIYCDKSMSLIAQK